jgi:L-seryl-tRNA(Ser) seleniumtransferase
LTLAALEATLAGPPTPVAQALAAVPAALTQRAECIAANLCAHGIDAQPVGSEGAVGGGGAPGVPLPSAAVSLPDSLAAALRAGDPVRRGEVPAVAGRIEDGRLLLDLRAVMPADDEPLTWAVLAAAGPEAGPQAGPAREAGPEAGPSRLASPAPGPPGPARP